MENHTLKLIQSLEATQQALSKVPEGRWKTNNKSFYEQLEQDLMVLRDELKPKDKVFFVIPLEVGKYYRTRDNQILGPLEASPSDSKTFPFVCNRYSFTQKGKYWDSPTTCPLDLMEEVPNPNPKVLQLEIGKRYIRRDGEITGPIGKSSASIRYPFWDSLNDYSYTSTGHLWVCKTETTKDLVEEYVETEIPFEIGVGKVYINGYGDASAPIVQVDNTEYCFKDPSIRRYFNKHGYLMNGTPDDKRNLVKEIKLI